MKKKYHIEIDPYDGPYLVTTLEKENSDYPKEGQEEIKRLQEQIKKLETEE